MVTRLRLSVQSFEGLCFTNNDLRKFTKQHQLGVRMSDWIILRTNLLLRSGSMSKMFCFCISARYVQHYVAFDYKISTSQTRSNNIRCATMQIFVKTLYGKTITLEVKTFVRYITLGAIQ
jgi:hypothetical protein